MRKLAIALLFFTVSAHAQTITPGIQPDGSVLPKVSGRFYGTATNGAPANTALGAANTLYATPLFIASSSALKTLSFNIGTGNAAAWNARMCVYADNGSGAPGSLIADTGTIAISSGSVTGVQTSTLSSQVQLGGPAWYWTAFMADSASESLYSINGFGNGSVLTSSIMGGVSANAIYASVVTSGVKVSQTFGACPATFGAATAVFSAATPYVVMGF